MEDRVICHFSNTSAFLASHTHIAISAITVPRHELHKSLLMPDDRLWGGQVIAVTCKGITSTSHVHKEHSPQTINM